MKSSDLAAVRWLGAPTISPDGGAAVVAVRRIDVEADGYTSALWLVPLDAEGGRPRQITFGWHDSEPAYSPDGAYLGFLRSGREADGRTGKAGLWVMPTAVGEPRRVAEAPSGISAFAWQPGPHTGHGSPTNPGSQTIAFLRRDQPAGRDLPSDRQPPRRITRLEYRRDSVGFLEPRHIWTVELDGEPTRITEGDVDHTSLAWNPAGDLLTFAAAGHPERRDDKRTDIWVCAPDGSGVRALTRGGFEAERPRFTSDGTAVVFTGSPIPPGSRGTVGINSSLWRVPVDGGAEPVRLTDAERHNLGAPIEVTEGGTLFPNESRGAIEVLLVRDGGGEPEPILVGARQVQTLAVSPAGIFHGRVVATVVDAASWGELVVREPDGTERVVTSFGADFAEAVQALPMTEVAATARDGYEVHGWLVRPSAADRPYPLLLMIHGGPFTQYGWTLFDEAQVYAGAGYAVLMANPRGSSGYGQAHGRAIAGNVGEVSAGDLMALLDHVCATEPDVDRERLGVLGGSHGGYMTTWLAAHEGHRFRAAVSERAVNAIDSFTGSSDIGWYFADGLYGLDLDGHLRQSPMAYADRIGVPMLIIHSEQDWRCPIEQAQRLYVALRKRGAIAEMLVFPGEGHEMSRSGLPSHRVARFEAILDWFARYL